MNTNTETLADPYEKKRRSRMHTETALCSGYLARPYYQLTQKLTQGSLFAKPGCHHFARDLEPDNRLILMVPSVSRVKPIDH